jgi:hypothetical protein
LKRRLRGLANYPAGRYPRIPIERPPGEKGKPGSSGSYEFRKKSISRVDLRDPYHLAVALTWPQFLAALLALYLFVNAYSPHSFGCGECSAG